MKKITSIISSLLLLTLIACESDFLERVPKTEITETEFFNTVADLETYSNGFYRYYDWVYADHRTPASLTPCPPLHAPAPASRLAAP